MPDAGAAIIIVRHRRLGVEKHADRLADTQGIG
jgi:hypothetical protein